MKIYFVIFVIVLNVIYDVNGALISTDKVLDPPQGTNPPQNDTSWKANETLADRLQRLRLRSKLITTTPKIETLSTQTVPETQNQTCRCIERSMCVPKSSLDKITLRSDDKKCQNPSEVCCPDDMEEDSMVTPEPPCECVPLDHCRNGETTVDIRIKPQSCSSYLQICCSPSLIQIPAPQPPQNIDCGLRNEQGTVFNITGHSDNEANFGEFPWMVAILENNPTEKYLCGGSLIDPSVILTAAHCVQSFHNNPHALKIRAGEWDTQTTNEPLEHQDRFVSSVIIHPGARRGYKHGELYNDIALVFLTKPVEITKHVNTICLPTPNDDFDNVQSCFSSGWGKDKFGVEGKNQVILKRQSMPIVPYTKCVQKLRETRLGGSYQLHQSYICAGGEPGKDMCTGDGGSPLVCPIANTPGRYTQAGIVAWGIGCHTTTPGVYVDVAYFRNWIDEQMELNHLTTTSYRPK